MSKKKEKNFNRNSLSNMKNISCYDKDTTDETTTDDTTTTEEKSCNRSCRKNCR